MDDFLPIPQDEIASTLASVTAHYGEDVSTRIQPILMANIKNGRFETFGANQPHALELYVDRLIEGFLKYNNYFEKLQIEKDDLIWASLQKKIGYWVFKIFVNKGFDSEYTNTELVPELTQEASIQILKARFTYDTEIDPWAYQIVRATCFKFMRSAMKKSTIPADQLLELDDALENNLPDNKQRLDDPATENHAALLAAINRLSPERREVILQKYFYEYPSEEIAENTHKTVAAVYSMHFNAIENLRKILSD